MGETLNQHKRYRIDLRKKEADYFETLAEEKGIPVSIILKMMLHDVAKHKIVPDGYNKM